MTPGYELGALRILEMNRRKQYARVVPETADDFWHLYNIIREGDMVYARTTREMKADEKYGRPKRGERVPVFLGVSVEGVEWDRLLGRLRVRGVIRDAPEDVPAGVHHTLSVTLNTPVTVVKKAWAEHEVERLQRACRESERSIIIVSIDDEGYAIATTTQYGVEERVEQRIRLPGKLESERREAATGVYFRGALNSLRQVWGQARSPVAVVGVGFTKNDFVRFLRNEAPDLAKSVVDVKSVNNGGVAGIYEALRSGVLLKAVKQLRVSEEAGLVEEVLKRLGKGESNVTYGLEEVERAARLGAVERLVLADAVLRGFDEQKRLLVEEIMRTVERKGGGTTTIVSSEHEAGSKLVGLGGVAALLRFTVC